MTKLNPPRQPAPRYSGPQASYQDVRPLDRADLRGQAQAAYRMGDVFYRISDVAQQKLTDNAVADAQREGAKLGGLNTKKITVMRGGKPTEIDVPLLTRAEGSGAVARAWNQAAEASYAMRLDTATMQHIQAAAAENPANPEGLRQSLEGFRTGIQDAIPPDLLPKYERDLYAMAQPLITRAETEQMKQIAHDQAVDAQMAIDTLIGTMVINSSLGPEGAIVSAAQFKNYVDGTQARIGPYFSEADARAEIHNTLADAARGSLQAAFEGAPDKRAMMRAFMDGKPVVSLPAVDADGEVTTGLYDKDSLIQLVGPDKVQSLVNGLSQDIRLQESEARARAAEAKAAAAAERAEKQSIIQMGFDDAVAEAGATGKSPMSATDIYDAYGGTPSGNVAAAKMVAKLNLAAETGSVRKAIAGNSPAEDAAFIESLKPVPGTPDFAEQASLYNTAVSEYQNKIKALDSTPADYVMQNNETVRQAWAEAADGDAGKVQAAVAATKQAQIDLGVPPERVQVMPDAHAAGLASTITSASPDTVAQTVDGITAAYGEDGMNQVMGKGVPPMVKAVAFADSPSLGAWRQKAIQAMQIKESVLKEQAKARGVTADEIETALEKLTVPLQDTMPSSAVQPYLDAVRQVALFNVANNGMDATSAAADAWSAFASSYTFNGTYRVPKQWDGDQVSGALLGVIERLDTLDIRPAIVGAGGAVDPAFAKAETISALKAGHYRWVTNSKETGVILTYEEGNPVRTASGAAIEYTFDELATMPSDPARAYQEQQQRLQFQGQGAP